MKLTSTIKMTLFVAKIIVPILIFNPCLIAQELQFTQLPGTAKDIGIGADGTVWVIGTDKLGSLSNENTGDTKTYDIYGLHRWNSLKQGWEHLSSQGIIDNKIIAKRISVDPDGRPWILNDKNGELICITHFKTCKVKRFWDERSGNETDIGVGAQTGLCYGMISSIYPTGYVVKVKALYKPDILKSEEWGTLFDDMTVFKQTTDELKVVYPVNVDTDGNSNVWFTDAAKSIGHFMFSNRQQDPHVTLLPKSANDIGVNSGGDVWVVGTNPVAGGYEIFELVRHKNAEPKWKGHKIGAVRIDVDPIGNPWFINDKGQIFRAEYPPIKMEYWREQEGKFNGQWVQRAGSSVYDAVWIAENGDNVEVIDASLIMHRNGNQVTIDRINSSDGNNFQYKGNIYGNKVVGTFVDSMSSGKIQNWNATIFTGIYNPGHRWTLDLKGGDRNKKPAFMYLRRHGRTNIFNGSIPDNGEKTQFMIAIVDGVYPTSKQVQFVAIRRDIDNENRKFGFFRPWQNYTGWPPQQVFRGMYTGNDKTCSNLDKMEDECTWAVIVDY